MSWFKKKHNPDIAKQFDEIVEQGTTQTEAEFLDNLNVIVKLIAEDDSYTTDDKLKIYELLSQISNCSSSERRKYASKLRKKLL